MSAFDSDTIAAVATAAGRGGVGIVRLSGPKVLDIAQKMLGYIPTPRFAHYGDILDHLGEPLDQGISLYFKNPHSFTGEDVIEFQAHGGPIILDMILGSAVKLGARLAQPGEFSQRAFINDKLDLVQAEAVADLINSTSEQAARCALRSLEGAFSKRINNLVESLISLRVFVEAAIDFPEEEVDFLADESLIYRLDNINKDLCLLIANANQGTLISEGIQVVIAGKPNAGKSSLLNALAEKESAIVTSIEGTTRDVVKEHINIDGMPLHIIDTAGLRDSNDEVEKIGIDRAWQAIEKADQILFVFDATEANGGPDHSLWPDFLEKCQRKNHITLVRNKVDALGENTGQGELDGYPVISLAAKTGDGINLLREHLKQCVGYDSAASEGVFTARRRHLQALLKAEQALQIGKQQLLEFNAGELLAEELRIAQEALGEITGKFSSDDLLGEIFSSFCIGK